LAGYLPGGLIGARQSDPASSLFHFSDTESKTDDYCFVGFPAIWNVVALLFAFDMPAWAAEQLFWPAWF
jgi:phosphatidylserine synthase